MKRIIKQYFKQILILIIIVAISSVLNNVFTKSSIKGDYDAVTIGITEGTDTKEIKKYLEESFINELYYKKDIEVEAVGSFGTEFRVKSSSIVAEERDFISIRISDKYKDSSVSSVSNNPEANYRVDYIMYAIYFIIIIVLGLGGIYLFDLLIQKEN